MIGIFCRGQHGTGKELCAECSELLEYAYERLGRCPFGEDKPTCAKCPVHCYKRSMREKAVGVMRYAGPRMAYRHPLLALSHWMDGFLTRKREDRP